MRVCRSGRHHWASEPAMTSATHLILAKSSFFLSALRYANHCELCSTTDRSHKVEGRPDVIIDLASPGAVDTLSKQPFTIKEGVLFRMKARFRVQHEVLSGLKYIQVVKRGPLSSKMQEMIGSYSPNTTEKPDYEKKCKPSGLCSACHS